MASKMEKTTNQIQGVIKFVTDLTQLEKKAIQWAKDMRISDKVIAQFKVNNKLSEMFKDLNQHLDRREHNHLMMFKNLEQGQAKLEQYFKGHKALEKQVIAEMQEAID